MNAEYDVVIIGSGAAGIGAGRVVRQTGSRFCLLEAKERTGGRAWTDASTFDGVPWDRGCHWLHDASQNPLRKLADEMGAAYDSGFSFRKTPIITALGAAEESGRSFIEEGLDRIDEAGRNGLDVPAAEVLQDLERSRWYPVFVHTLGLITSAAPEELSTLDYSRGIDAEEDYPVRDGLGALVVGLGRGLPIHRQTRVTHVDWSGRTLRITTEKGEVRANRMILTVSTSVLDAGRIRFTPSMPVAIAEAVSNCPLGCCEKVAVLLDRPVRDERDGSDFVVVAGAAGESTVPVTLFIQPFGRPLVIAELAGSYMPDLLAEGSRGLVDAAIRAMIDVFGHDIRRKVLEAAATEWTTDPDTLGAYSYARPGRAAARPILSQPIGERIFLAGEAASVDAFSTCHGAYQSGTEAANRALASLAGR